MIQKRCVSWIAVSSEEQAKKSSPADQRADNMDFINKTLPLTYGVQGQLVDELEIHDSRSIIELREAVTTYPNAYGRLEELIKSTPRAFDILVCRSFDRLGRTRTLISTIEELCEQYGILIVAVREGLPPTLDPTQYEGSSYVSASRGASAKEEIVRLKNRRDRGMKEKVRRGEFPGISPFGYTVDKDGKIQIDPTAAATVRRILIDLYLREGMGTQAIAVRLNEENRLSARGLRWTHGGVAMVLQRVERYAGWIEFNKDSQAGKEYVRVRGEYPQIITDEELAQFVAAREDRFRRPVRKRHLLTGVCYCTGCKKPLTYHSYRRKDAAGEINTVQTLRCNRTGCDQRVEVRAYLVVEAICLFLEALSNTADPSIYVSRSTGNGERIAEQIAAAEQELESLEKSRQRTIHAYTRLQVMEEDEFVQSLESIERQKARVIMSLERLREQEQEQRNEERRVFRFEDIQAQAAKRIEEIKSGAAGANIWLRNHLRVWIKPGSRYDDRIDAIEIL